MLWELYIFVSGGGGGRSRGSVSEIFNTKKVIFKVTSYRQPDCVTVIIRNNWRALKVCAFVMAGTFLSP